MAKDKLFLSTNITFHVTANQFQVKYTVKMMGKHTFAKMSVLLKRLKRGIISHADSKDCVLNSILLFSM